MTEDHPKKPEIPSSEIKSRRGISPIWILPVVALLIAGWIAYKSVVESGILVTIRFENAQGIEKGKTLVVLSIFLAI